MAVKEKKRHKSVSLYRRILSFFIAVELVAVVLFGGALMYVMSNSWLSQQQEKLLEYVTNIAEIYDEVADVNHLEKNNNHIGLCRNLLSNSKTSKADIFVTDLRGNIVFCRDMAEEGNPGSVYEYCPVHGAMKIPGEFSIDVLNEGKLVTITDLEVFGEKSFVAAAVMNNGGAPNCIVYAVQNERTGLMSYIFNFIRIYLLVAIALILITSLIIYIITYNMTRPLRDMIDATKRFAKGDFSQSIAHDETVREIREFYDLSENLNAMAEDLEALERSRSDFVANVSHELKTPMTTIGGFVDGILDGTIDYEHQSYYLGIVSSEVKRLSRLVAAMLNISKMAAGELKLSPVRFEVTQMLFDIFIGFEKKIEENNINVKGLDTLTSAYIEADRDMINQVFYNLVDNAIKFNNYGGEIDVRMSADNEYVTVDIKNTGKVIESEDLVHVFERFYKGDKSRGLDTKSTGLGLFIVKNIVTLHGGEITVKNIDNKYTEFSVKLKVKVLDT